MSSSTSTPAALSSDARALAGICWRLVEAQYHVSTLKLVDSVAEQEESCRGHDGEYRNNDTAFMDEAHEDIS